MRASLSLAVLVSAAVASVASISVSRNSRSFSDPGFWSEGTAFASSGPYFTFLGPSGGTQHEWRVAFDDTTEGISVNGPHAVRGNFDPLWNPARLGVLGAQVSVTRVPSGKVDIAHVYWGGQTDTTPLTRVDVSWVAVQPAPYPDGRDLATAIAAAGAASCNRMSVRAFGLQYAPGTWTVQSANAQADVLYLPQAGGHNVVRTALPSGVAFRRNPVAASTADICVFAGGIPVTAAGTPTGPALTTLISARPISEADAPVYGRAVGSVLWGAEWPDQLQVARDAMATASVGNRLLFAGGRLASNQQPTAVVDCFILQYSFTSPYGSAAPAGDACKLSLPGGARYALTATTTADRYAFFAGGMGVSGPVSTVDMFDATANVWSTFDVGLSVPLINAPLAAWTNSYYAPYEWTLVVAAGDPQGGVPSSTIDVFKPRVPGVQHAAGSMGSTRGNCGVGSVSDVDEPRYNGMLVTQGDTTTTAANPPNGYATSNVWYMWWDGSMASLNPPSISDPANVPSAWLQRTKMVASSSTDTRFGNAYDEQAWQPRKYPGVALLPSLTAGRLNGPGIAGLVFAGSASVPALDKYSSDTNPTNSAYYGRRWDSVLISTTVSGATASCWNDASDPPTAYALGGSRVMKFTSSGHGAGLYTEVTTGAPSAATKRTGLTGLSAGKWCLFAGGFVTGSNPLTASYEVNAFDKNGVAFGGHVTGLLDYTTGAPYVGSTLELTVARANSASVWIPRCSSTGYLGQPPCPTGGKTGIAIVFGGETADGVLSGAVDMFQFDGTDWATLGTAPGYCPPNLCTVTPGDMRRWSRLAPMTPRINVGSASAGNRYAFFAGGQVMIAGARVPSSRVDVYDADAAQWFVADPLSVPRVSPAGGGFMFAGQYGGFYNAFRVFFLGGTNANGAPVDAFDVYAPE